MLYLYIFVKIDDAIHVHFYSNPYFKNTYHPYYNECKDKIEIEGIDYENTIRHQNFLNNEIRKYEEELYDFISVTSKAKLEFVKDRLMNINLNEYLKVKLTDKGKEIYRKYYNINDDCAITLDTDEEGYCKFQLGNFMQIFGEHLHKGYIVHAKLM